MASPATTHNLARLLRPQSIAVFGGSWAEAVIQRCLDMGFVGEIWPVHPRRAAAGDTLAGLACYASIAELPRAPDASFIGVNRDATETVIRELAARGAGGATCFASGFAETDDIDRQQRLIDAAGDMAVLGPNCYGLINYLDGALLWPDLHGGQRVERGVAIIAQSSNVALNLSMQRRGLPISHIICLGNQAHIGHAELIEVLSQDPRVSAIALHIEGLREVSGFAEAVRVASAHNTPIVALKIGESERAAQVAQTHTASLAGSDRVFDALLTSLGIARVRSVETLLETAKLLHHYGPLPDASVMTLSCSGGEAGLAADAAQRAGINLPPLSADHHQRIRRTTHPLVSVGNPFDYHTFDWGDTERLQATFAQAVEGPQALSLLILDHPSVSGGESWTLAADAFGAACRAQGRRGGIVSSLPECMPPALASHYAEQGLVPLIGIDHAMQAILSTASATGRTAPWEGRSTLWTSHKDPNDTLTLSEHASKSALAQYGLTVPQSRLVHGADALHAALSELAPAAVKAHGAQLLHKTELDAVRLHQHAEHSAHCWQCLSGHSGELLVERMAEVGEELCELITGVASDPVLGQYLLIGAGGVRAELDSDTVVLMLPASDAEIVSAIERLRIAPLLHGFRGRPSAPMGALINAIRSLQDYALAHQVYDIDINPLIVGSEAVIAADAVIRIIKDSA